MYKTGELFQLKLHCTYDFKVKMGNKRFSVVGSQACDVLVAAPSSWLLKFHTRGL